MQRTSINPVSWSVDLGFDAAELIEGTSGSSSAADKTRWTPTATPSIPVT